jgi:ABC-2 type transport system ATP-binding protein
MESTPLEVTDLSKSFGTKPSPIDKIKASLFGKNGDDKKGVHAVQHVSFTVQRGEIYGIIGANGSGKSTLIRMISTLLWADEGRIAVFGLDSRHDELEVRKLINRVSPDPSFFRNMSALENLLFFGRVYGLTNQEVTRRADEILDALDLGGRLREPMTHLSRGQQQKVAIARAFLTSPILMLLDEPTTGLDPASKRDVQQFILRVRREHDATILLTTHDMDEADKLCDRLSFLVGGAIAAEGTPLELRQRVANGKPLEDVSMETVFFEVTGKHIEEDEEVLVHG